VAMSHILTFQGIALFFIAVFLGTAAAILPGISGGTIIALFLPLSFVLDKYVAFMFLSALVGTGGFAGSMTSILLNVPGDSVNAPACLDGHPLAKQGKAGVAIGASATASVFGSVFGLLAVVLGLPLLSALFLVMGPPEFFALSIAAIVLIATVFTGQPLKGLVAGMLGMLLGFIGTDASTGDIRYAFGRLELYDGFTIVPAIIGLFAIPELFELMTTNSSVSGKHAAIVNVREGAKEALRRPWLLIRSSLLGVFTGLIPGVGQNLASWLSYFVAAKTSKHPETFGKGNIEGVIAPEATIDVKEAASMMALFVFGIPAGFYNAIFLAEFQIFGVVTGEPLLRGDQPLIWVIIGTIAITSVATSLMGFVFAGPMVRLTTVPVALLMPVIYVLGVVGATVDQGSLFGVAIVVAFGLLGIAMERLGYPRAPLLIGLILIPFAEKSFQLSLQISRGTYEFLLRPITLATLAIAVLAILLPLVGLALRRRRRAAPAASVSDVGRMSLGDALEVAETATDEVQPAGRGGRDALMQSLFALLLLVWDLTFLYDTLFLERSFHRLPFAAQVALAVVLAWIAFTNGRRWLRERPRATGQRAPFRLSIPVLRSLAWLLAFPILLAVLGTVSSGTLYTFAFVTGFAPKELTRGRLIAAVSLAAAVGGLLYFVFIRWLHIDLYGGLLM
jgi:putative tricarboxylic transport membrane protein